VTSRLEKAGIGTRLVFGGNLVRQPAFENVAHRSIGDLAASDRVMRDSFWVGVWPGLDQARLDYMLDTFERIATERAS
jgi:CDP-6-deoxy-D-xylo-4-hexulose-3-dehydrase